MYYAICLKPLNIVVFETMADRRYFLGDNIDYKIISAENVRKIAGKKFILKNGFCWGDSGFIHDYQQEIILMDYRLENKKVEKFLEVLKCTIR